MNLRCFSFIPFLLILTFTSHVSANYKHSNYRSFTNQFLIPQNIARVAVGQQPLVWDDKLMHYAQWYANQRRDDCVLEHSNGPYGENIFWGSGFGWNPAQAVSAWVDEKQYYNYGQNSCVDGEMCGHYTQIVWGSTTKVGCASVVCSDNKGTFMTCNYDPPGNYYGERPY
ncbi:pathogenesis-related protein pr-1-like [Trifolium pratense]|uniref:Pathogenesis-related protein pr-1-like n=1 Tax=Trifolium pratense TaxID=57577 RepID=A0A2K3L5T0_TRIPR|nr:pathogenesis-related protein PR-1-like [Trifolium pratense]PNX73887.1 pathogenesis-related protein pr-1-like [Trifolium pratense]